MYNILFLWSLNFSVDLDTLLTLFTEACSQRSFYMCFCMWVYVYVCLHTKVSVNH